MRRIVTVVYNVERHISITAYSPDEAKNAVIAKAVAAIIKRRLRGVTNRRSWTRYPRRRVPKGAQ